MIVRTLAEAEKTDRRVVAENGNWQSVRLSLKEDGMGHSFNITTIFKGTKTHIKYANHWESVYVISGKGKIEMVESGDVHELTPGTIYLLDQHDEHGYYRCPERYRGRTRSAEYVDEQHQTGEACQCYFGEYGEDLVH